MPLAIPLKGHAHVPLSRLALLEPRAILVSAITTVVGLYGGFMRCSRCQGLMVKAYLLDMEAAFGEMWTQSWRCTNCGALYDVVIEQNRLARERNIMVPTDHQPLDQRDDTYLGGEAFIRPAA